MTTSPNKMSDEELTKAIYEAMQVSYLSERHDAIKKLIKQHREAYALEARIAELENNKWLPNEAKWIEQEADRIAEIKAQQEEVK